MQWSKFLERKFLVAMGGMITGVLVAFGRQEEASTVDKVLGSLISVGLSLGWIAAETSRDNTRDKLAATDPIRAQGGAKRSQKGKKKAPARVGG